MGDGCRVRGVGIFPSGAVEWCWLALHVDVHGSRENAIHCLGRSFSLSFLTCISATTLIPIFNVREEMVKVAFAVENLTPP